MEEVTIQDIIRICNLRGFERTKQLRYLLPSLGLKRASDIAQKSNDDLIAFLKPFTKATVTCPTCQGTGKVPYSKETL